MRCFVGLGVFYALVAGGCSNFFPTFDRSNVLATPAHGDIVPLAEVANSVKCEMGEFLAEYNELVRSRGKPKSSEPELRLDQSADATIALEVAVSTKGGVTYTEVDLEKGDLLTAILVAGADGVKPPKLEFTGKGTTTATISLSMKQNAISADLADGLCRDRHRLANSYNPFALSRHKLGIKPWLSGFFYETWTEQIRGGPPTALNEIKLQTEFIVVAELISSFHRLITIVPISGFPLGSLNQTVTNKLTVTFKGKGKDKTPTAPSVSDCLLDSPAERPTACDTALEKWRKSHGKRPAKVSYRAGRAGAG